MSGDILTVESVALVGGLIGCDRCTAEEYAAARLTYSTMVARLAGYALMQRVVQAAEDVCDSEPFTMSASDWIPLRAALADLRRWQG